MAKRLLQILAHHARRVHQEIFSPQWWVCLWWQLDNAHIRKCGEFAVFGATRDQALQDAKRFLEYQCDGEVNVILRRPNLFERLASAWRCVV